MTEQERVDKFLEELSDLTVRHGITINGCGCCGSPYATGTDDTDREWHADDIEFNVETGQYESAEVWTRADAIRLEQERMAAVPREEDLKRW